MSLNLPLKKTRAALFALVSVTCIIGDVGNVNAIISSNSKKSSARHSLPPDVSVTINTSDIEDTIIVMIVLNNLLSIQVGNFLAMIIKDWYRPYWPPRMTHPRNGVALSTRTLGLQSWYLALNFLAFLPVLIPETIFAANRRADVKAFQGGMQLPDSVVQAAEARLGVAGIYWHYFPVRFAVIANWVNVFCTFFAVVASFAALSRRRKGDAATSEESEDSLRALEGGKSLN